MLPITNLPFAISRNPCSNTHMAAKKIRVLPLLIKLGINSSLSAIINLVEGVTKPKQGLLGFTEVKCMFGTKLV